MEDRVALNSFSEEDGMSCRMESLWYWLWLGMLACSWVGCAEEAAKPPTAAPPVSPAATTTGPPQSPEQNTTKVQPAAVPAIPKISMNADAGTTGSGAPGAAASSRDSAESRRELLAAMMPLQIMLGQWRGTTQRDVGDFKALDEPSWVWDFQSNKEQPEMVMMSSGSPYYREIRLTYLVDADKFRMTLRDAEDKVRTFEGAFSQQPEEFQGDDQKTHVKYKLELTQTDADSPRDQWQVTFNQQENHRYLLELAKRRGAAFQRFDTVATQRQGTSFAKSDAEYGERECIISGGLGTIQVSHKGKSYWVCCTGCKAAFEEDPESWIAEYEKKQAAKGI